MREVISSAAQSVDLVSDDAKDILAIDVDDANDDDEMDFDNRLAKHLSKSFSTQELFGSGRQRVMSTKAVSSEFRTQDKVKTMISEMKQMVSFEEPKERSQYGRSS